MAFEYIIAIDGSDVAQPLEQRLISIGVKGLTFIKVKGLGGPADYLSRDRLSDHAKVEIAVPEDKVEAITNAIFDVAHTGEPGDGIVTVIPVEKFYRIRTRSEGSPDDA